MNNFFAPIYELFFYTVPFSDDLFQNELYVPLGLSLLIISALLMVAFYYYPINRPSFSRWYHWLIILLVNAAIQFGLAVIIPKNKFTSLGIEEYHSEYYNFGIVSAFMSMILFIILSFMFRWWSTNCRRTPFPN